MSKLGEKMKALCAAVGAIAKQFGKDSHRRMKRRVCRPSRRRTLHRSPREEDSASASNAPEERSSSAFRSVRAFLRLWSSFLALTIRQATARASLPRLEHGQDLGHLRR